MAENAPQPPYSAEEVVKQRKALFLELVGETLEAKVMRDICYNVGVCKLIIISTLNSKMFFNFFFYSDNWKFKCQILLPSEKRADLVPVF